MKLKTPLLLPTLLLGLVLQLPAQAQSTASQASALSMFPVAVSVAAPVALFAAGAVLTVVAVETSARGTVWVLERASDGARASVEFSGQASTAMGAALLVTVITSGYALSVAGEVIAFVPNAIGQALLHNEQLTR